MSWQPAPSQFINILFEGDWLHIRPRWYMNKKKQINGNKTEDSTRYQRTYTLSTVMTWNYVFSFHFLSSELLLLVVEKFNHHPSVIDRAIYCSAEFSMLKLSSNEVDVAAHEKTYNSKSHYQGKVFERNGIAFSVLLMACPFLLLGYSSHIPFDDLFLSFAFSLLWKLLNST